MLRSCLSNVTNSLSYYILFLMYPFQTQNDEEDSARNAIEGREREHDSSQDHDAEKRSVSHAV